MFVLYRKFYRNEFIYVDILIDDKSIPKNSKVNRFSFDKEELKFQKIPK